MEFILLVGRILFAALFIGSGISFHLLGEKMATGYAQAKGVPMARITVLASGVLIIVGGLMIALGIWADLGALFLAAFLLPTALVMHNFWTQTDPQTRAMEMVQFNKDVALFGATLIIFVFYAKFGDDLGLNITDSLFTVD